MLTAIDRINWGKSLSLTPPKGWLFKDDHRGARLESMDEWEWVINLPWYSVEEGFYLVNRYLEESKKYTSLNDALAGYRDFERPDLYPPQITRSDWQEF